MNRKQTMKRFATAALCAVPAIAISVIGAPKAQAINVGPPNKAFAVQIGYGYLVNNDARDLLGSGGVYAGVGYKLPTKGTARVSLDVDYNNARGSGDNLNSYLVTLAERVSTARDTTGSSQPYVGIGIGGSRLELHSELGTDSITRFAGKVLAGVDMGNSFAEIAYFVNGKVAGVTTDVATFSLGTHF